MAALGVLAALSVGVFGYWLARRTLQPWDPVFSTVLARLQAQPERHTMADGVEALMRELEPRSAAAPGGPEALLMRLARDARDLRRVIDKLPVGVALIDHHWRVEYLNPTYTRLLGWTTEQVRGRMAAEFLFDAVERAEFARMFEQFGDTPAEVAARFEALTPAGQRVSVQWHLVPLIGADGRLEGAIAIVQDIRAERLAVASADALAGRLRALADAAVEDLMATLDLRGHVLEWSRGAERLTARPAAGALGQPLGALLGTGPEVGQWLLQARREGACRVDAEVLTGDGQRRHFEGSLYALGLATGSARFGVILRDVTAQREVHRALETSEERLRLAIDAAQIGTWDIDLAGAQPVVNWSEGYGQTFGMPPERMPREPERVYALIHDDDREMVRSAFAATLRAEAPLQIEFRVNGALGLRWHAIRGRSQRGPDGRARRLVGVGMDVTARHIAEDQLREGRERLLRILQTMAEGLFIMSADGRYTMLNIAAERILGMPAERVLGLHYDEVPWRRWMLASDGDTRHPLQRLIDGVPVMDLGMGLERPDGVKRAVSINALPLLDGEGRFDGMVATFVDITERHEAELALADSQARLAAVVESASDAIISTDLEGRIALFNPAAERIFGHAAADMNGRTLDTLLPAATRAHHGRHLAAFARSGSTRRAMGAGRVQGRHADGRVLELEASISQALVRGQTVLTAILRDVTDRVAQERALESTRGELIELTRRLLLQEKQTTRRLAQALHDELGQTLTALRLHWEASATAPAPMADALRGRVDQLVVAANRQIRHVLGELRPPLLDDFGLAAALDNELQQQRPVDGRPLLALEVAPRIQSQRWPIDVEYAAFMIAREAVLNALHHAEASHVAVRLDGDDGELLLTVTDDGIGVAPERRAGRPGHLGLVGMRERALAISGTLRIDSAPGRGTIVHLSWTLPDEPPVPDR